MQKGDLSYRLNACGMHVHNELGPGHREHIYCRSLAITFYKRGIAFEREVWLPIYFEEYKVGYRRADFVIENNFVIEVKALKGLEDAHKAQTFSTLKAMNRSEALLLNFGAPSLEFKHVFNKNVRPESDFQDPTPALLGELDDDLFESRNYLPTWEVEKLLQQRRKM
jgi:GxxExxY protein